MYSSGSAWSLVGLDSRFQILALALVEDGGELSVPFGVRLFRRRTLLRARGWSIYLTAVFRPGFSGKMPEEWLAGV